MEHIKIVYDSKTGEEVITEMTKSEAAAQEQFQKEYETAMLKEQEFAVAQQQLTALLIESLPDEKASIITVLFPEWNESETYMVDDRRQYNGLLYKCTQNHKAQANWTPTAYPAGWARMDNPAEEWPAWRVWDGNNASLYKKGDKVSHKSKHWIATLDNNHWEPGSGTGWGEVT